MTESTGGSGKVKLLQLRDAPGPEDFAAFAEHERDVISRRWRIFAPLTIAFLVATEIAPYFTPEFPHAWAATGPTIAVIAAMWWLAVKRPSRAVLGWASVLTAVFAAGYIATAAAETGRFESLHVLAMTVLIAMVPGILSLSTRESIFTMIGSVIAWATMCAVWRRDGAELSYDGLATSATYLVFLSLVVAFAVSSNRKLRLREFVARREIESLHRFAVEEVLCRHLPPRYVERVLSGETLLDSPPERRVVTILFADIVGFTPLCEKLPPEELARTIARFYEATSLVAFEHGGTIDKFIGDAVMAMLGAPDAMPAEEQARRALAIANGWRQAVKDLLGPDREPLTLRIGIHQEQVAVGSFGGRLRSEYTVLGRGVNIAARLEQRCRAGQILVSNTVFEQLDRSALRSVDAGPLELKGIPEPVHGHFILPEDDGSKQAQLA